ncbi:hypothetical protein BEL04_09930 [Mucilaginibacter sp. PPCGB 2223]|nr:hypothetical protein BEL04_09930 [Mucilaginibacter sp. PPCGB 2223]
MVVVSHFGQSAFGAFGFWGVELFFGLSGFLIGQIIWRNFAEGESWNFKRIFNFWSRRWWRTLPNYYLFFGVTLLIAYINHQGIPSIGRLTDYLWFGQSLTTFYWGFYVVAWSLCVEEWFYFLFPLVLWIFSKAGLSRKATFACALALFFIASMIARYIFIANGQGDALRTITFSRLDSIACGVLVSFILAVIDPSLIWKRLSAAAGIILAMAPVVCMFISHKPFDTLIQNPIVLLIVPLGFALTLPAMNLLKAPAGGLNFISGIVKSLSLWSYSIYLSHLAIMWQVYYIMNRYRSHGYVNFLSKIIGLAMVLLVSSQLFKYFEKPLTEKRPAEIK